MDRAKVSTVGELREALSHHADHVNIIADANWSGDAQWLIVNPRGCDEQFISVDRDEGRRVRLRRLGSHDDR